MGHYEMIYEKIEENYPTEKNDESFQRGISIKKLAL